MQVSNQIHELKYITELFIDIDFMHCGNVEYIWSGNTHPALPELSDSDHNSRDGLTGISLLTVCSHSTSINRLARLACLYSALVETIDNGSH